MSQSTITAWMQREWRRADRRPQPRSRGRRGDNPNLDAQVPNRLFKAAKLMGKVAQATRTATQARQNRPQLDVLGGECQESFSKVRRKEVPKSLENTLDGAPQHTVLRGDSGQLVIRDGATEFFQLPPLLPQSEVVLLALNAGAQPLAQPKGVYIGGKAQYMFTNHSSGAQMCKLYIVVPRENTNKGPNPSFADGLSEAALGAADQYTTFGARPGDSAYFRDRYRILKVISFCLSPGETHMHYHDYNVDKIFDDFTEDDENITEWLAEWTIGFCLSSHGVAATSSTGGDTTTTADGQINYVYSHKHRMKFFNLTDKESYLDSMSLPAKGTITTRVYNQDTSAPENVNTGD